MIKHFIYVVLVTSLSSPASLLAVGDDKTELYVTDRLRLSLYSQASDKSKVLRVLTSGDKLIIEEVAGLYAKVTTTSGKVGWVKRGFLVSEPPAKLLLRMARAESEQLEKELVRLNNSKMILAQYEKDMDALSAEINGFKQEKLSTQMTINNLEQEVAETKLMLAQAEAPPDIVVLEKLMIAYWHYVGLIILMVVLVGVAVGKIMTESKIKRKFNGVKVW